MFSGIYEAEPDNPVDEFTGKVFHSVGNLALCNGSLAYY